MSKLKLAVVGTGHWGPNLLRNFNDDPRVDVKLICDVDKSRAMSIAAKYRNVETTTQIEDVATRPDIDAVVLCTPTNTHYEIAKKCLENNKHLFIEKPMATTSEECRELIRLATKRNRKLMIGHVFLFNPAVQYIKGLIDRGELGDIIYIYGKRVNLGPIRKDVNALWDLAPHDIAIFNYWLKNAPLVAHATGIEHLNPPLHDVVFMSLKYPNNIMASLHVSWLDPRKERQIVVVGTKKMVVFDDMDPVGPVHIYDKTVTQAGSSKAITDTIQAFKAIIQEGDLVIPKIPQGEPLKTECRAFADYILEGKAPICTGENGLEVVQVLEAATRSLYNSGVETRVGITRTARISAGLDANA
jgi:predicted dehydrogenase